MASTALKMVVEPLSVVVARYKQDPDAFTAQQDTPVVLFEPPEHEPLKTQSTHQLHTIPKSGYQLPLLGPSAVVVSVRSSKSPPDRRITVGRYSEADIIIDHASISRQHAWFEWAGATRGWQLSDAGSRNGTVLNSRRMSARMPHALGVAATIGFGDVNAQFFMPSELVKFLAHYR